MIIKSDGFSAPGTKLLTTRCGVGSAPEHMLMLANAGLLGCWAAVRVSVSLIEKSKIGISFHSAVIAPLYWLDLFLLVLIIPSTFQLKRLG